MTNSLWTSAVSGDPRNPGVARRPGIQDSVGPGVRAASVLLHLSANRVAGAIACLMPPGGALSEVSGRSERLSRRALYTQRDCPRGMTRERVAWHLRGVRSGSSPRAANDRVLAAVAEEAETSGATPASRNCGCFFGEAIGTFSEFPAFTSRSR